jgi:hypothetical protein
MLKWDTKLENWLIKQIDQWSVNGEADKIGDLIGYLRDKLCSAQIPEESDNSPYEHFENGFNLGAENWDKKFIAIEFEEDIFIFEMSAKEVKNKVTTWIKSRP